MRETSAEPAASLRSDHEEGAFLNLKERLGGCIFRAASNSEANEFVHMRLFRAPEVHFQYIRYIKEGMPIFLLVGAEIWGHFDAAGDGELATKMDGIHLAQVQIKIVKQYVPMPASMFLPIIGASFNLKSMPLELTRGQAKSLLHTFMNSHLRSHQHREGQSNPLNSNPHAYPDSWGYNRFAPPPVPADRKYTTSIANHGEIVREAQEHRNPQPKPFKMPVAIDPADSRPPPPPPPPNYFRSSSPYYAEDLQHSSYRHGFREGSKAEYAEGYSSVDHFDKPSKSTQTDPDHQKVELDNRIAALTNDIHSKGKNLEQMQEAVRGLQQENRKLKDALKEKEDIVKKQLLELDDVRAEFFSFYDEENVQKGQPSGQQHATLPDMVSPPISTREHPSYVYAVPQSAPGQTPLTFENAKGVLPHNHEHPQQANGVHGAGPGRSQTAFDQAASEQQLFPVPNAVMQQLPQFSTATSSSSQPMSYFYVPDTSVTANQEQVAHHSRQPSVERVVQYQKAPEATQHLNYQQRDLMSERNAQDVPYANFPQPRATIAEENASLPRPQANAGVQPPQGQAVNLPQPQMNVHVQQLPDYHASLPQPQTNAGVQPPQRQAFNLLQPQGNAPGQQPPAYHISSPRPHGNAVSQRLPSPQKTRSTNALGPLGDLPSPRSYSPSGSRVSQNQMGVGYESYVAKGNQDAWRR